MNSIEQSIIDIISQYSLKKHILINDSFVDIGLDSVDFVMLFFDIEKYLKRKDKVNLKETMQVTLLEIDDEG